MNVAEVVSYWRLLVQEPDETFITDANVTVLLRNAYREFRGSVGRYSDNFYITTATIAVSGGSYDLATAAVTIMGATPTNTRMRRLINIADVDSASPGFGTVYQGVSTRRALFAGTNNNANLFYLEGTTLWFENDNTGTSLLVTYEPVEAVDWTVLTANTFIDELPEFHDLIALYAARRYQAIDASDNRNLNNEIKVREGDLEDFFSGMRSVDDRYIQREEDYSDYGGY